MYTIWAPGVASSCEREMPHILKGKCRDNGSSGSVRVYNKQKRFAALITLRHF